MGFRLHQHLDGEWTLGEQVIVIPDITDDEAAESLSDALKERGADYTEVYVDSPHDERSARLRFGRTFQVGSS